ncbi:MAG: fibronectin type III domain-containing protein, partial [Thermoplasmata archaeon]|nr:fibronectin type III domain-containing protein [Thermoplasmata archaeon]
MKKSSVVASLFLTFVMVGVLFLPIHAGASTAPNAPVTVSVSNSAHGLATASVAPSTPAPAITFPRTVVVETFTGVWCPHCPAESQALYGFDKNTSHNVLNIAELHVCYTSSACYENYVPPDGTSTDRGTFYNVCGFPDVFFDGVRSVCGATNSQSQMATWYQQNITTAAAFPGNVSIAESATFLSGNVTTNANITSGITGSYNVVSYLLEYIGKTNVSNGNGPHDLGNVVRETLRNHPVNLTAGATTEVNEVGAVLPAWNQNNLSVVTIVQQNSTKIVENANMVSVSTLATSVIASPTTVGSGGNSTVTVHVTNVSTGSPVSGASVTLTSPADGFFTPASGATAADGTFTSVFTAPLVSSTVSVEIAVAASAAGLVGFATTTITVTPLVPPSQPTGLTVTPGVGQVTLNWTAPATGGGGVTYVVYDATASIGPFTEVNVTTGTVYVVTGLLAGHSYWYKVEAMDAGGYSPETSAISANAVTGAVHNLPASAGWWVSIDSMNFSSATSAPLVLYLPDGVYEYTYGTEYYARVAANAAPAPVTVSGAPA